MPEISGFPENLLDEHEHWHHNHMINLNNPPPGYGYDFLKFHQDFINRVKDWYRGERKDMYLVQPWTEIPQKIRSAVGFNLQAEVRATHCVGKFSTSDEFGKYLESSRLHGELHKLCTSHLGDPFMEDFSVAPKSTLFYNWHGLIDDWWNRLKDAQNLADGRPFWIGDFNGDGRKELLYYSPNTFSWWLGVFNGTQLDWRFVGNSKNFGQVGDGRPFWIGNFNGGGQEQILFYFPGDHNWWIGTLTNNAITWIKAGNTSGFGRLNDGRPFWVGNFIAANKKNILFYYPGDRNWWLGTFNNNVLTWNLAGNTKGFGQVADGRPFWVGDFTGEGKQDILFYYPGDFNWWLGTFNNGALSWQLAGNTKGFGQVADGRPIWAGNFNEVGKNNVLFYYPGDGNWWHGAFANGAMSWNLAGNTGKKE